MSETAGNESLSKQYNLVADQYDISFQLAPYRLHVEAYSVFKLLGDVTGLRVLDVATGTGFYARELRRRGAAEVVGVDIAEQMVQIAQMAEQQEPLGISYHIQDVTQFHSDQPFDLVLAIYLLHYAPTREALAAMCRAISSNLKSGGRFVTYQFNPDVAREPNYYGEYGLNVHFAPTASDGESVPFSVSLGGMTLPEVTTYRWERATLEAELTQAGFRDIRWIEPSLSEAGSQEQGADYYKTYLAKPHALLVECVKN